MIKITCVKEPKKAKNITVGNEYEFEGDNLDSEFITIVNDKNEVAKYHTGLFKEVEVKKTEDDFFNDLQFNTSKEGSDVNILVKTNNWKKRLYLEIGYTIISCGVYQLSGISNIIYSLGKYIEIPSNYDIDTDEEFFKKLYKLVYRELFNRIPECRFIICSTNKEEFCNADYLYNFLDEHCDTSTDWEVNPNSDNEIKVWVLNSDDNFN